MCSPKKRCLLPTLLVEGRFWYSIFRDDSDTHLTCWLFHKCVFASNKAFPFKKLDTDTTHRYKEEHHTTQALKMQNFPVENLQWLHCVIEWCKKSRKRHSVERQMRSHLDATAAGQLNATRGVCVCELHLSAWAPYNWDVILIKWQLVSWRGFSQAWIRASVISWIVFDLLWIHDSCLGNRWDSRQHQCPPNHCSTTIIYYYCSVYPSLDHRWTRTLMQKRKSSSKIKGWPLVW